MNPYATIVTQDLLPQKIRQTNITKAMLVNETLCAKINGRDLCSSNHSIGVIHNVTGLNIEVDGIISFGPYVGNMNTSSENFLAGLMNGYQNRTDGIDKMEVYIDFKNKKIDFEHASSEGFQKKDIPDGWLRYPNEGTDYWGVRIEDFRFGSTLNYSDNSQSANDPFNDHAVIDSIFPGFAVPKRIWNNTMNIIMNNLTTISGTNVSCNYSQTVMGVNYSYCAINTSNGCNGDLRNKLNEQKFYLTLANKNFSAYDINGTNITNNTYIFRAFEYTAKDYALDMMLPLNSSTNETTNMCMI